MIEALELYRGEFLPGVFARNAPDVERWIATERARLRDMAVHAAWSVAEAAVGTDGAMAARYAGVAAALTPDDEEALVRRMLLLDRVGDRAAARRAYEDFALALATEFPGEVPSDATRAVRERMSETQETPHARIALATDGERVDVDDVGAIPAAAPVPAPRIPSPPRFRASRAVVGGLALGLIALTAWGVRRLVSPPAVASISADASSPLIAVMPFTIRGGQLDYLRDGMVDLLSIDLDGAGGIRVVEPIALLDVVRQLLRVQAHSPQGGTRPSAGGRMRP